MAESVGTLGTMVDLVELVRAIVKQRGMSWEEFDQRRERKNAERGAFDQRRLLDSVSPSTV